MTDDTPTPELEAASAAEPQAAGLIDDGGIDSSFSTELEAEVRHFGQDRPSTVVCQWCGAPLPDPAAETCPSCSGRLKPIKEDLEVPGLTALSSEARAIQARAEIARLREAAKRGQILPRVAAALASEPVPQPANAPVLAPTEILEAVRPPETEVRRLMLEMEIAARRAAIERDLQPLEMGDEPEPATMGGAEAVEPEVTPGGIEPEVTPGGIEPRH